MTAFWITISILIPLIISSVFIALLYFRHKKYKAFIVEHSKAVRNLTALNQSYRFHTIEAIKLRFDYDNENLFEQISCEDYLTYYLRDNEEKIKCLIKSADENQARLTDYKSKYETRVQTLIGQYDTDIGKLRKSYLDKSEQKILSSELQVPITSIKAEVRLYLTNLHETSLYGRKRMNFTQKEITSILARLDNKRGNFYLDRNIWDSLCRVERGKVTNKLRFRIYERDGERCVHCGSTRNLEIDHIIPVSKGGKSIPSNLQTLCHKCNLEKGNRSHF